MQEKLLGCALMTLRLLILSTFSLHEQSTMNELMSLLARMFLHPQVPLPQ